MLLDQYVFVLRMPLKCNKFRIEPLIIQYYIVYHIDIV